MSDYRPFTINNTFVEDTTEAFLEYIRREANMGPDGMNWTEEGKLAFTIALRFTHAWTTAKMKSYVDAQLASMNSHYANAIESLFNESTEAQKTGERLVETCEKGFDRSEASYNKLKAELQVYKDLTAEYKRQVDELPADIGSGAGGRMPKIPEPKTYKGTADNKPLDDWLNQIALYCAHQGIVTDKQKIVIALLRIEHPAALTVRSYLDKVLAGQDVGSWDDFVSYLRSMYGQRDEKEGAKDELTKLWENKSLAARDFIKYAEQYKTLASMLDYEDKIHIDKLENVMPKDIRSALEMLKVTKQVPTKWDAYLDTLLMYYKELNPEKTKASIFGNKDNGGNGNKSQEANSAQSSNKGKGKDTGKHCKICAKDPKKRFRANSHDTSDCWSKPENASKRPERSTPAASGSNSGGNSKPQGNSSASGSGSGTNRFKAFRARIAELSAAIDEMDNDGAATGTTSAGTAHINTARIEEVEDLPLPPAASTATAPDEASGSASKPSTRRWRRSHSDFPETM